MHTHAEYIDESMQDKQRIVILGDSDTTAILGAMVIHVLAYWNRSFGYITDSPGLTSGIKWQEAPMILFQTDAYAVSAVDQRPQFLAYNPHIAVISSLAKIASEGEHSLDGSIDAFNELADGLPKAGILIYNADIPAIRQIGEKARIDVKSIPYRAHPIKVNNKQAYLVTSKGNIFIANASKENLEAVAAAYSLLRELAVTETQFYEAISSFEDSTATL